MKILRVFTDKPMVLGFLIKLEFKNVGFYEERKTNGKRRSKTRTNNKLNPLMTQSSGCQPRQLVYIRIHKVGVYKTRIKDY